MGTCGVWTQRVTKQIEINLEKRFLRR